jgi:hypothetical protein
MFIYIYFNLLTKQRNLWLLTITILLNSHFHVTNSFLTFVIYYLLLFNNFFISTVSFFFLTAFLSSP